MTRPRFLAVVSLLAIAATAGEVKFLGPNRAELVMAVLTTIYVGATMIYVFISNETLEAIKEQSKSSGDQFAEQLKVMGGQLSEMKNAAEQTEKLIVQNAKQADALHSLTSATFESVHAAKANTQALISSERPWVVVALSQPSSGVYQLKATNYGRTPAKITGYFFKSRPIPAGTKIQDAKILYVLAELKPHIRLLTHLGDWLVERINFPLASARHSLKTKGEGLAYYGMIRYEDLVSEQECFTAFCYEFDGTGLEPVQDTEYFFFT